MFNVHETTQQAVRMAEKARTGRGGRAKQKPEGMDERRRIEEAEVINVVENT